jgi:hypothetical protein
MKYAICSWKDITVLMDGQLHGNSEVYENSQCYQASRRPWSEIWVARFVWGPPLRPEDMASYTNFPSFITFNPYPNNKNIRWARLDPSPQSHRTPSILAVFAIWLAILDRLIF